MRLPAELNDEHEEKGHEELSFLRGHVRNKVNLPGVSSG